MLSRFKNIRIYSIRNASRVVFEGDLDGPKMVTAIPGPRSLELLKQMDQYQDTRTQHFFVDYNKSKGNYIVDADGNVMLDVLCSIASQSIGYNNPRLIKAAKSDEWTTALINRPALGIVPPIDWARWLEESLLSVKPKGLQQVFTAMCGSCANETAFKAIFMAHQHQKRGRDFSAEDLSSCMSNSPPGSPDLAILAFTGGFHGRLFGALSTTNSKPLHKVDIPAFQWPHAPFPKLRYPLEENKEFNEQEENRCLEETERIIKQQNGRVAGMIIEPIQGEGGDNWASPKFFRALRKLAKDNHIVFAVDEVQTGVGATGKFWAHEHWNLETPPDVVVFAKKMQATGFFHNLPLRPSHSYRNFNTWMGDPIRTLQAREIIREIKEKDLVSHVQEVGSDLKKKLEELQKKYSSVISNVRGVGTFLAFDLSNPVNQVKFMNGMRQKGVEISGCGDRTIRLRPMLVFGSKQSAQLLERIESTCQELSHP